MIELAAWASGWRFEVLPCGCRETESPSHVVQRYCEEHTAVHQRSWILASKDYLAACRMARHEDPASPQSDPKGVDRG